MTDRCLESLAAHIHDISSSDPRLLVINDSPGDRDVQQVLESFARRHAYVMALENETNLGFVKTANRGLAIACRDGRDAILVNADTETFKDTLKNLMEAAYSDPQIGFASPRSNNASLCSLPHLNSDPAADQTESYRRWHILSRTLPPFHFVPTAVGFYLYVKHAVIANFGYLDTEFGVGYQEENDLIFRANKVGYRAVLANKAFAYHAGSASFNLLKMNMEAHQNHNLQTLTRRHAEFLPLVRRYEASAHYRAEALLSHALSSASGRLKIVFDLTAVGPDFNGTNEMSAAIVSRFHERHAATFEVCVICTRKAFAFHKLNWHESIRRLDVDHASSEKFAIGVRLSQPFSAHSISVLEDLAVVNVFGMLDSIAEDCGYLAVNYQLGLIWGHLSRHANGLFFISGASELSFLARHPDAKSVARYSRLLSTKLSDYKTPGAMSSRDHVLILGNHFAHKACERTAEMFKAAFPNCQCVVIGAENGASQNLRTYKAGTLGEKQMEALYRRASAIVLPSYVEGFGFGLLHALAMGKVVVARNIPVTRDILSTYRGCGGVFLYADDGDFVRTLNMAMKENSSRVDDEGTPGWDSWVDGFARFCATLTEQDDIFDRACKRIDAGDLLRKAELLDRLQVAPAVETTVRKAAAEREYKGATGAITDAQGRRWQPVRHVKHLLDLDGEEFVCTAYVSLLGRPPDSDGLVNYLTELQSGISKMEIVSRLRKSSEWRQSGHPVAGYWWALVAHRMLALVAYIR